MMFIRLSNDSGEGTEREDVGVKKRLIQFSSNALESQRGFTMVELLITMVVFVFVMAAASQIFSGLLTQFKQQSKIAETNIEGMVGLDILRRDIEHAGYGLPWSFQNPINYSEATETPASSYNDAPADPPRGIVSGDGVVRGSDYLVLKAVNVVGSETAGKWTALLSTPEPFIETYNPRQWSPSGDNLANDDRVIVMAMGGSTNQRMLVVRDGAFWDTYSNLASWAPSTASDIRIVYGVDSASDLVSPFNRSDYFISTANVPSRCAPNTGVLVKAILNHDNVGSFTSLPLLDCVADFQVTFWLDTNNDNAIDWPPLDDISGLTAQEIRERLREVRIYVVAHEGQRDETYDFSMNDTRTFLSATEILGSTSRSLEFADLKELVGDSDYKRYRWKLSTVAVRPLNLR